MRKVLIGLTFRSLDFSIFYTKTLYLMSLIGLYESNTEMFETGADDVGQKILFG